MKAEQALLNGMSKEHMRKEQSSICRLQEALHVLALQAADKT